MQGPEIKDYQLYLFDLDGTLTRTISGEKFPKTVDDREFIEGRWEKLLDLAAAGKKTAIVDLYKNEFIRRKPGPGMLVEAMDFFGIDRQETLMIGDRPEDQGAADAAGVDFQWEWEFFGGGPIIV